MTPASGQDAERPRGSSGTGPVPASALYASVLPMRTPAATVPLPRWIRVSQETLTRVRAALTRL